MMGGCGSPQNQVGDTRRIFDGIMLRQKAAEASAADDDPAVLAGEVPSHALDVVDDLLERVGLGPGALAVASEIEGQHPEFVAQLAVDGEVRSVIPCLWYLVSRGYFNTVGENRPLTHSSTAMEGDHKRRIVRAGDAIGKARPIDVYEVDHPRPRTGIEWITWVWFVFKNTTSNFYSQVSFNSSRPKGFFLCRVQLTSDIAQSGISFLVNPNPSGPERQGSGSLHYDIVF